MNEITISCLHATARAGMAIDCFHEWREKAVQFDLVEWIFGVDESDTQTAQKIFDFIVLRNHPNTSMAINYGHQSCNAAINKCARICKGEILVDVCDDVGCPPGWDKILRETIPNPHDDNVFVKFGDGQHSELAPHPVISRKRYEMLGYFMHPDYDAFHGYSDEDATLRAKKDGSYMERLDIIFEHRHPAFGKGEWDNVYLRGAGDASAQEVLWKHHPEKRK